MVLELLEEAEACETANPDVELVMLGGADAREKPAVEPVADVAVETETGIEELTVTAEVSEDEAKSRASGLESSAKKECEMILEHETKLPTKAGTGSLLRIAEQ